MAEARVKLKSPKQHSTIYIRRLTLLFLQSSLHTFQDSSTSEAVVLQVILTAYNETGRSYVAKNSTDYKVLHLE